MSLHTADSIMTADRLSFVDEVPRFWFSRRWRLSFLGFVGFLIVSCQRISIEVTMTSMLNQTTTSSSSSSSSSSSVSEHRHDARGYWVQRLGLSSGVGSSVDEFSLENKEEFALAYYGGTNGTLSLSHDFDRFERTTPKPSRELGKGEEIVKRSRMEKSCSNASELAILNTTFFTLKPKGDISWSATEQLAVLDAFYWGDLLIRLPSGFLSQRYGGKRVFGFSILLSSICTAVIPITSRVHYFAVILLRFFTGISAGATIPAMSYLLGRWSPPDERCFLQSITNTGTGVSGTVISVPLIGLLCIYGFDGGWPSVFYISGGLGMLWSIIWMLLASDSPNDDSRISIQEKDYINNTIVIRSTDALLRSSSYSLPNTEVIYRWEVVLTSLPVFALAVNHFTHEWTVYSMTKVIPIYLNDVLHMDFKENSIGTLVLPSVGFWCVMAVSAGAADRLQAYGVLGVTKIRKLMHAIGAVLAAAMMASVLLMDCHHHLATLSIVTIGLAVCGLQHSGALVAHLDLVPGCSGVTLGAISTLGASVYFVLPCLVRIILLPSRQNLQLKWSILLLLTASCHIFAALLFLVFGSTASNCWSPNRMPPEDELNHRRGEEGSGGGRAPGGTAADGSGDGTKNSIDNNLIFDASNGEFPAPNNIDYFSNTHQHSLRRQQHQHPHQQQSQTDRSDDVYLEALDTDPHEDELDTNSSSRSVNSRLQRQSSDDSCSHSCVSAASQISEGFLAPPITRPSNTSNETTITVLNRTNALDTVARNKASPMTSPAAVLSDELSESIV